MNRALYLRRKANNYVFLSLSVGAALFGLVWLSFILYELIVKGSQGLSFKLFTEMTPAPGSDGGLLNAIAGSVAMSTIAVFVGTPIGILAGTYLAEYGRYGRLAGTIRFLNDILLSAPSILIGLFVYVILVLNDPASPFVGRYEGPSAGMRFDFFTYAALKLQYNRVYLRNLPEQNGFETQMAFTF